jgi:trehalose 6-phosphate synthase
MGRFVRKELLTLKSAENEASEASWREPAPSDHLTAAGEEPPPAAPWPAQHDFVAAACRLPVDLVQRPDGGAEWRPSPGGLVSALEPVMRDAGGAWVGWTGAPGDAPEPFEVAGMHLVGVGLSAEEVRDFYEGFSNATLWPLYHDVIAPP